MDEVRIENGEFFIDTIVSHQTNRDKRHSNAKVGDALYRVRWVAYDYKDETSEPLPNLKRSHVISYQDKCNIPLPKNINASIDDADTESRYANDAEINKPTAVSYTHLRAHETREDLVCRLLLEK